MLISAEHDISNPYLINIMQFAEILFFSSTQLLSDFIFFECIKQVWFTTLNFIQNY